MRSLLEINTFIDGDKHSSLEINSNTLYLVADQYCSSDQDLEDWAAYMCNPRHLVVV